MGRNKRKIILGYWTLCLEKSEQTGKNDLCLHGTTLGGQWVKSSPLKQVYLGLDGWHVQTTRCNENYLLFNFTPTIEHCRGLWGKAREEWSLQLESIPSGLKLFARLWEDPINLYWNVGNLREINKWKRQYGIEVDRHYLNTLAVCMKQRDNMIFERNRAWSAACKERAVRWDGICLCLNPKCSHFYEGYHVGIQGAETGVIRKWSYASVQSEIGKKPLTCVRSQWDAVASPRRLRISVSYRILGQRHVELVSAVCQHTIKKREAGDCWRPEKRSTPEWFFYDAIMLYNTGSSPLYISGIAGDIKLISAVKIPCRSEKTWDDYETEGQINADCGSGQACSTQIT